MKKGLLVVLSAILLITSFLFTSCDSWMQDDDFYSDIENDVKVANAASVNAYIRYANSKMGTTEPSGSITKKVDVPFSVSAVTNDDYGFVKWVAYSTSDFPTNQQHTSLVYESAQAYARDFKGKELSSGFVSFTDPTNPITDVNIYAERDDIFIMPLVAKRPTVVTSVPSNGRTDVVKNSQIRILFSKPIDENSLTDEFGNSNIQVTSGRAVLTENSDDMSALDITEYFNFKLSKTKKMLTISAKKNSAGVAIYKFDNNAQISVTLFEDLKDSDGFSMNGSYKFSFTTGTKEDSLAPRIDDLTAGIGQECLNYQQYKYNVSSTNYTQLAEAATNTLSTYVSEDVTLAAAGKVPVLTQRVKDKLNIFVRATDIAGAGAAVTLGTDNQSENDVALVQVRACLYVDKDGNPVTTSTDAFADGSIGTDTSNILYIREYGYSLGMKDSDCQVNGAFETVTSTQQDSSGNAVPNTSGTLFTYDLSRLDDGLIKIDLWAVDMVGNSGDEEAYAGNYNNGYRSIFVVKDSTAPDAVANKDYVEPDLSAAVNGNWFNQTSYASIQIQGDTNTLVDNGASALVSKHDDMKWVIKPTADTSWANTISKNDSAWQPITDNYSGFTLPSTDGPVTLTYALMDDLGNISSAVPIQAFNYDGTLPSVKANLSWIAEAGSTAGIASDNTLDTQTLVIPVKEITAGIKKVDLTVKFTMTGTTTPVEYTTPFGTNGEGLEVVAGGTTLDSSAYTASGKTLTFTEPQTGFESSITIKNIKVSNAVSPAEREGSYSITARITDAANNITTITNEDNTKVALSIDSTPAVINRINVPDIKKAINFTDTANEAKYWIDFNSTNLDKSGSIPVAKSIYVTFTENNSGAKIFDFTGSNMSLQSSSVMYKVTWNESQSKWVRDGAAIASNPDSNKFTLTTPIKSSGNGTATVEITNVKLYSADSSDASYLKLKISDTATNISEQKTDVESGSWTISAANGFYYDSSEPVSSEPSLEDNNQEGSVAAEDGYTNSEFVKATFTVTPTESGIESVTIVSGAVFEGDASHALSVKVGATTLTAAQYQISSDKKTITFKKTGDTVPAADSIILKPSSGAQVIEVNNLKLTGRPTGTDGKFTDGDNLVKFTAKSFGGKESAVAEKNIVLDVHAPVWIEGGLYTEYDDRAQYFYPHPEADRESGNFVYGTTVPGAPANELYFYTSCNGYYANMKPDYSDSYKKSEYNIQFTKYSDTNPATLSTTVLTPQDGIFQYYSGTTDACHLGKWSAKLRDKAGNESDAKIFHTVSDSIFSANEADVKDYMTICPPENAKVFTKNNIERNRYYNSSDFNFALDNELGNSSKMCAYEFVIQKNTTNPYLIKIKLGSGLTTSDLKMNGNNATSADVQSYTGFVDFDTDGKTKLTETATPIEYYSVSHWYQYYRSSDTSTNSFVPYFPEAWSSYTTKKCEWQEYKKNSTRVQYEGNSGLYSSVDENGDIIIELPKDKDCPPLSLLLKDGCGNTIYCNIKPSDFSATQAVCWLVDGDVGLSGFNSTSSYSFYSTSTDYMSKPGDDVTFYKLYGSNTNLITFGGTSKFSDTCRYSDGGSAGGPNQYTMRSRIIAWTGNNDPEQADFVNATTNASDWYYYKEYLDNNPFNLENNLPVYTPEVDAENNPIPYDKYKLFYIIEDYVGNNVVKPLQWGSAEYWLYDNTPPSLTVNDAHNVNTVDGKNYFNGSSTSSAYVEYTISDPLSGIKHNGASPYTYSSFGERTTEYNPTSGYSLAGKTTSANGETISIDNVIDWAGNPASSVGLTNGGSNLWVSQDTAPVLASDCVSASRPNTSQPALAFNDIEDVVVTGITETGKKLPIIGGKKCTKIDVTLKVEDEVQLLGWYTSKSPLSAFSDFYTLDDIQTSNNAENIKRTITYNSTSNSYTCSFEKKKSNGQADTTSTWKSKFSGEWYFYPVNRAGLICKTPVVIEFVNNPIPTVKTETITYSGVVNYGAGTDSAVNYTKSGNSGSFITFETTNSPSYCYLIYGTGTNDLLSIALSSYKVSDNKFKVPLAKASSAMSASTFANKELKLQVLTTSGSYIIEESDEYALGIASDGSYNAEGTNKWTFDETAPTVNAVSTILSYKAAPDTSVAAVKYPDTASGIYYIDSNEAFVALSSAATDIDYWEWDNGTGDWNSTPLKLTLSEVTLGEGESAITYTGYKFTVPAQTEAAKTYQFRAVDKADNKATAKSVKIRKDNEGPVLKQDKTVFTYVLKNGSSTASTDYITDEAGDSENVRNIRYNTAYVTKLYLDYSCIEDKSSGIAGYYYNDTKLSSGTNTTISLSSVEGTTASYIIKAKDNVGHEITFMTINLIADSRSPILSVASVLSQKEGETSTAVTPVSSKYWIKGDKAIITLAGTGDTVGENGNDLKEYQWDKGLGGSNNWETISLTDGTYSINSSNFESEAKTYNFRVLDTVGHNSSAISVTLQKDSTPPTGTVSYTVNKDSSSAQVVDANHPVADYKVSISNDSTTTTITYNPNKVNKIVFTPSITDTGSGYDALYRRVTGADDAKITDNTIELTPQMDGEEYVIIAKDNAGNTLALGTYVFKADSAAPALTETYWTTNDGVRKVKGYSATDAAGTTTLTSIPTARDNQVGENFSSNYYSQGTKIFFPKTAISSPVKYQFALSSVQENDTDRKYDAASSNSAWTDMVVDGDNYEFTLPDITTPHCHLALFFMDALGNISPAYYIGSIGDWFSQWWIMAPELSTENVTISNVCVYDNSAENGETNEIGWKGSQDYLVSIKLPKGAVIHSVSLSPAADPASSSNTGFVWALGASNNYTKQINFTGYTNPPKTGDTPAQWKGADMGTDGWINLADSTAVGMQLKVYVHPKKDASTDMAQSDPKIIINGNIELEVFPTGGYHSIRGTGNNGAFLPTGLTSFGNSDNGNSASSRIVQFINTVTDTFSTDSDFTADSSVTDKPAKKAKKAAKKAKKQAKKASEKVVSTGSTTAAGEKPVMAVETAEIVEQNLTSAVPELTVATEAVVSEIAGVTEMVSGESEVITTIAPAASADAESQAGSQTSAQAEADEGSRSPSKSASIVIMLAILSSFSAVWYLQRNRKK